VSAELRAEWCGVPDPWHPGEVCEEPAGHGRHSNGHYAWETPPAPTGVWTTTGPVSAEDFPAAQAMLERAEREGWGEIHDGKRTWTRTALTSNAVLLDERDAAIRRAERAEKRVARIIAAYEKTHLEHDVAYEDFVDVVVNVRQLIWFEERDARAALRSQESQKPPETGFGIVPSPWHRSRSTASLAASEPPETHQHQWVDGRCAGRDCWAIEHDPTRASEPPETEDRT